MRDKVLSVLLTYAEGGTVKSAWRQHGINATTFYGTLNANPDLQEKYEQIQKNRADMMADEIYEIGSDEASDPRRARVQIEARARLASFYDRKRFGDKVDLNVQGQVDITAALAAARGRVQPLRDLRDVQDADFKLIQHDKADEPADLKSAALPAEPAEPAIPSHSDIFEE